MLTINKINIFFKLQEFPRTNISSLGIFHFQFKDCMERTAHDLTDAVLLIITNSFKSINWTGNDDVISQNSHGKLLH